MGDSRDGEHSGELSGAPPRSPPETPPETPADDGLTGRATDPWDTPPTDAPTHPTHLALRYRIERMLDGGRGGFGTVFAAFDALTRTPVVIKLLPVLSEGQLRDIRREVVSLRQARLPGLVRLLDEGVEGRHGFIVMERVEGRPFPGWLVSQPHDLQGDFPAETVAERWERLRPVALGLLEALARLHAAGLVHRDLKPANVLVDDRGVVTLLDLGLACAPDLRPEINGGTVLYAAPEQFDAQGVPTAATDLYAVGVMIYEALTGEVPHVGAGGWREMSFRRMIEIVRPPPGLPPEVARALGALLRPHAHERPADALAAITAFGGHPGRLLPQLDLPPISAPEDLEGLFHGPEPFLHLPSDAAHELWNRTAGRAEAVRPELAAWIRAGLAYLDQDRLRIRRDAIDLLVDGLRVDPSPPEDPPLRAEAAHALWRLRLAWPDTWPTAVGVRDDVRAELVAAGLVWPLPDGRLGLRPVVAGDSRDPQVIEFHRDLARKLHTPQARVRHLLSAGAAASVLLPDLEALAEAEDFPSAWPALRAALSEGRGTGAEPRLLELLVGLALLQETSELIELTLLEVGRSRNPSKPLEDLLRAMRAARQGHEARALEHLDGLAPFEDERLEYCRQDARLTVARTWSLDRQAELLESIRPWAEAGPADRRARYEGWWGHLEYRRGHFAEAARLHTRAMAGRATERARLRSLRNRASALLELSHLDEAARDASAVRVGARLVRMARLEADASWIERSALYRLGQAGAPDLGLVQAAAEVHPQVEAMLALNEAAVAWRGGLTDHAIALAKRAEAQFALLRYPMQRALADAFLMALTGASTPERAERALEVVPNAPVDCAHQISALVAASRSGRPLERPAVAGAQPPLEILSAAECAALTDGLWA